jgi:hypothetical protein
MLVAGDTDRARCPISAFSNERMSTGEGAIEVLLHG